MQNTNIFRDIQATMRCIVVGGVAMTGAFSGVPGTLQSKESALKSQMPKNSPTNLFAFQIFEILNKHQQTNMRKEQSNQQQTIVKKNFELTELL